MRLVDPLLAPGCGLDQPGGFHFKSGGVQLFEVLWHPVNRAQRAVEVLQVHDHHVIPEVQFFQVAHQVAIDDGELARQVRLDRKVAKAGFDGRVHTHDVGDGGRRCNGGAVGIAHAVLGNLLAQCVPVHGGRAVHFHITTARLLQHVDGVKRQDALAPQRALVGCIAAPLACQFRRRPVSVVADGFHGGIGKLDRLLRCVGNAQLVQAVLKAHQAQAHRAVAQVRVLGLLHRVVVDVDHVVEHPHRGLDGLLQLGVVQRAVRDVLQQIDRTQVAHCGLGVAGVERDLGAQVAGMHHAGMLLGRPHVAGVLERDPGVAGFEQHRQHLAPQIGGGNSAGRLDFAACRLRLVGHIGLLEFGTKLVVQVGHVVGREQGPLALFHHAAHEQVGNPVGGVHVVRAAAVVTGVLAQLQKLLDVQVPGFQVGANGALALAALVHRHSGVIDHLEERHHALRFAVGALDVAAQGAYTCPVIAQTASKFGQQRVFLDRLVNAAEVVRHGGQVAARQLRAQRAAVEQRGRAGHEVERGQHLVELNGARFAVRFFQCQAHGHTHEKRLWQFNARFFNVQEIAVKQRLQTKVVELQVTRGLECFCQARQVIGQQLGVQ